MFQSLRADLAACFLAIVNSLVFDWVTRQKIGGTHLTYTYLTQLPVLPPEAFSAADLVFIVPRVVELVSTAWDVQPFAADVWADADAGLRAAILAQHAETTCAPALRARRRRSPPPSSCGDGGRGRAAAAVHLERRPARAHPRRPRCAHRAVVRRLPRRPALHP
jgi:hypothetical protein